MDSTLLGSTCRLSLAPFSMFQRVGFREGWGVIHPGAHWGPEQCPPFTLSHWPVASLSLFLQVAPGVSPAGMQALPGGRDWGIFGGSAAGHGGQGGKAKREGAGVRMVWAVTGKEAASPWEAFR